MNLRRTYARVLLKTLFPRKHLSVLALHTHGVFAKRVFCFDDTFSSLRHIGRSHFCYENLSVMIPSDSFFKVRVKLNLPHWLVQSYGRPPAVQTAGCLRTVMLPYDILSATLLCSARSACVTRYSLGNSLDSAPVEEIQCCFVSRFEALLRG